MSTLSIFPTYVILALVAFQSSLAAQEATGAREQAAEGGAQKSARKDPHAQGVPNQNPLIARMGQEEIRLVDLIREVNRLIPLNFYHRKIPQEKMLEFRKKAFDSLTLNRRIYLDALDRKLPLEEAAIRAKLESAFKEAGPEWQNLSKKRFSEELEKNRSLIRRLLLTERNKERFEKTISGVTDDQLLRLYDQRLEQDKTAFQAPREARLLHILIKMDPSRLEKDVKKKRTRMAEAKKELDKGTPFAQVARLYSEGDNAKQGGDLGWVKEHNLRSKELSDRAFQMKSGEVSEVFESLYGLHILKCVEIKPIRTLTFDEIKPTLALWLKKEHQKLAEQRWYKELEANHPIEILAPDLIVPPQRPKDTPDLPKKDPAKRRPESRPMPPEPVGTQPSSRPAGEGKDQG